MAFFTNRMVNHLNVHWALVNVLDQSFDIFAPLYLFKNGFSIAEILLLLAGLFSLRLPLRVWSIPLVSKFGIKPCLVIGTVGYGLSFLLLPMVKAFDWHLFCYMFFYALFNALHWYMFHLLYTLAGQSDKRGRQVAAGQALTIALCAGAPLLIALLIGAAGFQGYSILASILGFILCLNLVWVENVRILIPPWKEGRKLAFNIGSQIHLCDAASFYPVYLCWILAIFLCEGQMTMVGGIIGFGILMQIIWQLVLGSLIDRGSGTLIVHVAATLRIIRTAGRALAPLFLPVILGLEAISGLADVHQNTVQATAIYNAGRQARCPFWYWFFAEAGWDVGAVIGNMSASLLLTAGVSLRHVMLMTLVPTGILWMVLYRYFYKLSLSPQQAEVRVTAEIVN